MLQTLWCLRRSHVAALDGNLAELSSNAAVVDSGRDHAYSPVNDDTSTSIVACTHCSQS